MAKTTTETESQMVKAMVALAAVFAESLAKERPDLRDRFEEAAEAEFRALQAHADIGAAAALALFLGRLHNQKLVGQTPPD